MESLLLCIFPAIVLIVMLIGIKFAPKGSIHEDFMSLQQGKILQGLAAIGIILHHLTQEITNYGSIWKGPITIFSSMGILFTSIFFFYSGYGLMTSLDKKPDYLKTFMRKRMPSVLLPFMLSNAIYLVFVAMYFGYVNSVIDSLICFWGFRLVNTNTWFLVEILILYLAFYFTHRYIKDKNKALYVLTGFVGLMVLGSFLILHDESKVGGCWFMGEWWYNTTAFFLAGLYFARYADKIVSFMKKHYKWLLPVSVVGFVLLFGLEEVVIRFFGYYQEWEGHPGYGAKLITLLAQTLVCGAWISMLLLIQMKVRIRNKVLILLSKISLELYIVHDLFMKHMLFENEMRDLVLFIWVMVSSLGVAVILHLLIWWLLHLITANKVQIPEDEMNLDQKLEAKIKKKRKKTALLWLAIVVALLTFFVCSELYVMYVQPKIYYEEEIVLLEEAKVGDVVPFGTMNTDYIKSGDERILWYVADRQGDKMLLVSVSALAPGDLHNVAEDIYWAGCSLREELNGTFYEEYINDYEKELVIKTDIVTSANPVYGTGGGRTVQDYVFILSADEVELYFPTEEERNLQATQAAARDGVNVAVNDGYDYKERQDNTWWWTRTKGSDGRRMVIINPAGEIDWEGKRANVASGGIRPAIWVSCTAAAE